VYEVIGCIYHGHTIQTFREISRKCGDIIAERHESTMVSIEQIPLAGNQVEVEWDCEFDEKILAILP